MAVERIGQLFAGGKDGDPSAKQRLHLLGDLGEEGARGVEHHVRPRRVEQLVGRPGDAAVQPLDSQHLAEILVRHRGVHGADQLQSRPLEHSPGDLLADRAQADLHHAKQRTLLRRALYRKRPPWFPRDIS